MRASVHTSATMSIRQLRNVNLTWARPDLGDLDELKDSIDRDGLQLPILLTPTMLVADGARRLVACETLGWEHIPVLRTMDWDDVIAYYDKAEALAKEGFPSVPMPWAGIAELYNVQLKELYAEKLRLYRKERADYRRDQGRPKERQPDVYIAAIADLFGFNVEILRAFRECYTSIGRLQSPAQKGEDPERVEQRHRWAKYLTDQVLESELDNGARLYGVLNRCRIAIRGEDPTVINEAKGRRGPAQHFVQRRAEEKSHPAPIVGRSIDVPVMANIMGLLDNIAETVRNYTHVRPDVPAATAAEIAASMKIANRRIGALIKVIGEYGNNPNLEERST